MMAKVNARRKSRKDTVKEKKFPISDVAITDMPLTEALVLRRKYYYGKGPDFITNVPHLVIFYSETGFSFGFHGKGPLDLAINVCEWYLRHIGYYGPRTQRWSGVNCQNGDCFELTFDLHEEFCRDFIERVPDEGTTIPFADLKNWFDNHV
jgi:hypothetical protein